MSVCALLKIEKNVKLLQVKLKIFRYLLKNKKMRADWADEFYF